MFSKFYEQLESQRVYLEGYTEINFMLLRSLPGCPAEAHTDEGGRRAKVSRVEDNDETLVISDSENEEVTLLRCIQYAATYVCSGSFKVLCVV